MSTELARPAKDCRRQPLVPRRVAFYLAPNLSMIAFASALEPLRVVNRLAHAQYYTWTLHSETGGSVRCSNGVEIAVDDGLTVLPGRTMLLVCSGVEVGRTTTRPVLSWLRRCDRHGVTLGALCTGAHILAKAGLLEGRRCTIHWENLPAAAEEFPGIAFTNHLYEIDGDRYTCAGGAAATDMMLRIIADDYGEDLASLTAEQVIHVSRNPCDRQRLSVAGRYGVRHPRLAGIIQTMENNVENPLRLTTLAEQSGVSMRQLERLFRRYLRCSPKRYYMEIRMQRARNLLLQTDMSIINVALASGFTSSSHFSRCYRHYFERTPYRDRGAPARRAEAPAR